MLPDYQSQMTIKSLITFEVFSLVSSLIAPPPRHNLKWQDRILLGKLNEKDG